MKEKEKAATAAALATAQKAVTDARNREQSAAQSWEKEKERLAVLERDLAAAQKRANPHKDDNLNSDADSPEVDAVTSHLHAQAAAVPHIRSLVGIVLDSISSSSVYARWRDILYLTLRRYALDDHVLSDHADTSMYWYRLDGVVLSWLLGAISVDMMEIIHEPSNTARQAWLAIEEQFLGQRETCILHLEAQFHVFMQGDLNVTNYCCKMKTMADALHDLGHDVSDRQLVLNLLRGLNK